MRVRLIAVGKRMPKWVREAYGDYVTRLGPGLRIDLLEIEPGARFAAGSAQRAVEAESVRLMGALRADDYVVALDERGTQLSTRDLSKWLAARMTDGRDLSLLVGGPDGLAAAVLARSDYRWSLSALTLPHALVRVVVAEQLYRAHGLLTNHPYHRG